MKKCGSKQEWEDFVCVCVLGGGRELSLYDQNLKESEINICKGRRKFTLTFNFFDSGDTHGHANCMELPIQKANKGISKFLKSKR